MSTNLSQEERKRFAFLEGLRKKIQGHADKQEDRSKFLKQISKIIVLWQKDGPMYSLSGDLFCSNAAAFLVHVVFPEIRKFARSKKETEKEMEILSNSLKDWIPEV